jgi:hypothetical protein
VSIVAASLLFGGGVTSVVLASRSVTRLDAVTGKATSQVSLGAKPLFVATDTSGAWAATAEGTVVHIGNPSHPRADITASVDFRPSDLAVEDGDPWVADSAAASVARVSPRYERVVAQVPLPHPSERAQPVGDIAPRLAAGDGSVWVAEGQTTVIRIDPRTNTIGRPIRPRTGASGAIAYGAGAVWVGGGNSVAEISPASGVVVSTIRLDATPAAITVAAGSLWIALGHTATIVRIDPYTDAPIASIDAGGRPLAIAALRGTVWVLTRNELVHIDAATNAITRRIKLRGDPLALAATDTTLWVAAG